MYRRWRREDQSFHPSENLYMRFEDHGLSISAQEPTATQIIREQIRTLDQSVNRSKYSRPEDVLFPRNFSWGILAFPVCDVPNNLLSGTGISIEFKVTHVPLWNNYAHSEIHAFNASTHHRQNRLSNKVKREFRQTMQNGNVRFIKRPSFN